MRNFVLPGSGLLRAEECGTVPHLEEAIASIAWKQVSKWPRKQDLQAQLACPLAFLLTCLLRGFCGLTQEPPKDGGHPNVEVRKCICERVKEAQHANLFHSFTCSRFHILHPGMPEDARLFAADENVLVERRTLRVGQRTERSAVDELVNQAVIAPL